MKQLLSVVISASLLFFVACEKGDMGPQGEPGPAGPPGSPNVKYSEWFTPATYKKDTLFGIWGHNYNQPAPAITQQVLDSGLVLTYARLLGYNPAVWPATQVSLMPINLTYYQGGFTTDTWSALASVGNLKIRFVNDLNIYHTIATQHKFRYVIIPGGLKARGMDMSYENICRLYDIPE